MEKLEMRAMYFTICFENSHISRLCTICSHHLKISVRVWPLRYNWYNKNVLEYFANVSLCYENIISECSQNVGNKNVEEIHKQYVNAIFEDVFFKK